MLDPEDSRLLDALRGLRWPARRPPRRVVVGAHMSRNLAPSAELNAYRPYRHGDETRRIDWKLFGRTDRAYIRLAQDHGQVSTMLVADASASMAWPAGSLAKWRQAREIALGLAAAARAVGDPVGVALAGGGGGRLPVEGRPRTLMRIAELLRRAAPGGRGDSAGIVQALSCQRLVIVSDFLGPDAEIETLLSVAGQLYQQGGEIYTIHIVDDAELDPGRKARVLVDSEDAAQRRTMDAAGLAEYRRRFDAWRTELALRFRQKGAVHTVSLTSEPAALAVRRIVKGLP